MDLPFHASPPEGHLDGSPPVHFDGSSRHASLHWRLLKHRERERERFFLHNHTDVLLDWKMLDVCRFPSPERLLHLQLLAKPPTPSELTSGISSDTGSVDQSREAAMGVAGHAPSHEGRAGCTGLWQGVGGSAGRSRMGGGVVWRPQKNGGNMWSFLGEVTKSY